MAQSDKVAFFKLILESFLFFMSVVIPCALIAHLYGQVEGRRHDCALLRMSGLMEEFERRDLNDRDGTPYTLYGDTAYPVRRYLFQSI